MIKDMNHALDVRQSVLETEGTVFGGIPVNEEDAPTKGDIVGEIDSHFGLKSDDSVAEVGTQPSI